MEELLHYVWKHKILPLHELRTTDGRLVEVINPGIHNTDAGPDFFNAKVKIDGTLWVGNVEIHVHSRDWYRHNHDGNPDYDNVILHIASVIDCDIPYPDGSQIPQLQLEVPGYVRDNYTQLLKSDVRPKCSATLADMPKIRVHSWMSALQVERLESRVEQIMARHAACDKNWEDTFFVTIARNYGFGINGDAFELWAKSIPMSAVGKHRDDLFQIEAIFFGQAGLLSDEYYDARLSEEGRRKLHDNEYYNRLAAEYRYMRQKFSLTPIAPTGWRFLRLRPQNFPFVRIAQLAMLYYQGNINMSKVVGANAVDDVRDLLSTHVSDYWQRHYSFVSDESAKSDKKLSISSKDLLIINSVAPLLFAYGRYKSDENMCDKSIAYLEALKPERNRIISDWASAGVICESAADTQALIQLTRNYCDLGKCIHCRFGYEYIKHNPGFLREDSE